MPTEPTTPQPDVPDERESGASAPAEPGSAELSEADSESSVQAPRTESVLQRIGRGWALAGVFLVGLVIGGLVVGLLSHGSNSKSAAPPSTSNTSAPTPSSSGSAGGATGQVSVNAACVRAINEAQDVQQMLQGLSDAVRSLNAARVDEIIRQLEPLEQRLRTDATACQIVTRLPDGSTTTQAPSSSTSS